MSGTSIRVTGAGVQIPELERRVEDGVELVLAIGKDCRDIEEFEVDECIFGYTGLNNVQCWGVYPPALDGLGAYRKGDTWHTRSST